MNSYLRPSFMLVTLHPFRCWPCRAISTEESGEEDIQFPQPEKRKETGLCLCCGDVTAMTKYPLLPLNFDQNFALNSIPISVSVLNFETFNWHNTMSRSNISVVLSITHRQTCAAASK